MEVTVRHELFLTMVDGKVSQFLTNTKSCLSCIICKSKPTQTYDLKNSTARPEDRNLYNTGCLHFMFDFDAWK